MSLLSGPDYCNSQWEFQLPFEAGVLYMLRYTETELYSAWTDDDIFKLAVHLAEKKPWRDIDGWHEFIWTNLHRWRGKTNEPNNENYSLGNSSCGGDYPPAVL